MSQYREIRHTWSGSTADVGTSYTVLDLGNDFTEFYLEKIVLEFSSIVTMATFDWYLAVDSAGEHPITPLQTGKTVTTYNGSVKRFLEAVAVGHKGDVRGPGLYLAIKGNAGTFDVDAYVSGMRV